jgi:hypothetical protein
MRGMNLPHLGPILNSTRRGSETGTCVSEKQAR